MTELKKRVHYSICKNWKIADKKTAAALKKANGHRFNLFPYMLAGSILLSALYPAKAENYSDAAKCAKESGEISNAKKEYADRISEKKSSAIELKLSPLERKVCAKYSADEKEKFISIRDDVLDSLVNMNAIDTSTVSHLLNVSRKYSPLVQKYNSAYFSKDISFGTLYTESAGNSKDTSSTGCVGLFQLSKQLADNLHIKDRTNPDESFMGASKLAKEAYSIIGETDIYLRALYHQTGGPGFQKLVKYYIAKNIGEGRFEKDFGSTLGESKIGEKVLKHYSINYCKIRSDEGYLRFCRKEGWDPWFVEKIDIYANMKSSPDEYAEKIAEKITKMQNLAAADKSSKHRRIEGKLLAQR